VIHWLLLPAQACFVVQLKRPESVLTGTANCGEFPLISYAMRVCMVGNCLVQAPVSAAPYTGMLRHIHRVGQNHIWTLYMTVYLVISLPKKLYIHRICMVLFSVLEEVCRVGQNRIWTPYMTVCKVISLLKLPYMRYMRMYVWFWPTLQKREIWCSQISTYTQHTRWCWHLCQMQ